MFRVRFECILIICLIFSFVMTGCGSTNVKNIDETTLIVSKKGAVKDVIVEAFDKDYYSETELRSFFDDRVNEYALKNNSSSVKLTELKVKKGIAKAILDFDSANTFEDFYEDSVLFYGNVNEAYDNGFAFDISLKSTSSADTIGKADIMNMKKSLVIITNECVRIACPKNIAYVSANVEVINKNNARVSTDSTGLAYLLLK